MDRIDTWELKYKPKNIGKVVNLNHYHPLPCWSDKSNASKMWQEGQILENFAWKLMTNGYGISLAIIKMFRNLKKRLCACSYQSLLALSLGVQVQCQTALSLKSSKQPLLPLFLAKCLKISALPPPLTLRTWISLSDWNYSNVSILLQIQRFSLSLILLILLTTISTAVLFFIALFVLQSEH